MNECPLVCLSDDLIYNIVAFLDVKDIHNLFSTSRNLHYRGEGTFFWKSLLKDLCPRTFELYVSNENDDNAKGKYGNVQHAEKGQGQNEVLHVSKKNKKSKRLKHIFSQTFLASNPAKVRWKHIPRKGFGASPPEREGHVMVKLGTERLVLTGGFCPDIFIYVLRIHHNINGFDVGQPDENKNTRISEWLRIRPRIEGDVEYIFSHLFAYGCSLTAIDDKRMIRFGGFRSGGYTRPCNQLLLLTFDYNNKNTHENVTATWKLVETKGTPPDERAYHSATLVAERYIVILGGMNDDEAILSEAILDTQTWTWISMPRNQADVEKPQGRYGHSVILDEKKNRLLLFGGGNGCDLLRDGDDYEDVWEFNFKTSLENDIISSFPWKWRKIYDSTIQSKNLSCDSRHILSTEEKLNIARCHVSVKLSPTTVLFFSGGGVSSTNNLILFDLIHDEWKRLSSVTGQKPLARFTGAGAVIGGWFITHGGFSSQYGVLGDVAVLDLAPALNRSFETCFGCLG